MERYTVTGMSCAACQARVEKAVSKVPGVTECSVSLLTNSMLVDGSADSSAIIKVVTDAGYGARLQDGKSDEKKGSALSRSEAEDALEDHETPVLKRRLITSVGFLIVLMYFSMGHTMWGWPVPAFFDGNPMAIGLLQLILSAVIMLINKKFFVSGFKGMMHGAPNMDTLVALGSAASFAYSTAALFLMSDALVKGDMHGAHMYLHELYFESAAMILTLITVGKMLEAKSKGRTTDALKSLMKLAPKTATVIRNGAEETIPIEELGIGDIFAVRPGENIPADGFIIEGSSAVNEAALTGESIPVDKAEGDTVSAATINQSGYIRCRATRIGEDTTLSQIIKMVSDATATKAPIAKIADKVSGVFVPAVIAIAAVTIAVWMMVGAEFGYALARGISVLVISCPCALGLATPVAIMVGSGLGAKNGIMFKTAVSLEETGRAKIVVLDKTGTVTSGEPKVTDIVAADGVSRDELLTAAAAIEAKSEHPLARAIVDYYNNEEMLPEVTDFEVLPGNGLTARIAGERFYAGSMQYISSLAVMPEKLRVEGVRLSENGKTPLYFMRGSKVMGMIAVADTIKPESPEAIRQLKNMGIHVVMLTGDNDRTAAAIGREAGVSEVIANVLPDGKERVISKLKDKGKTIMVGDGINDAPALTAADIGIAIGAGTDVAIDAADVVLMKSRLTDIPAAIRLSRMTLKNIHENLFWAFFYNVLGIPLAAGCYIHLFGLTLNPMVGAAAMSLSSFFVVSNALRLNLFDMMSPAKDKPIKDPVVADGGVLMTTHQIDGTDGNVAGRAADGNVAGRAAGSSVAGRAADSNAAGHVMGSSAAGHAMGSSAAGRAADSSAAGRAMGSSAAGTGTAAEPIDRDVRKTANKSALSENKDLSENKEETKMQKTINIEGMMCGHCENAVRKALGAIENVTVNEVSHEKGVAVVELSADVPDELLKKTVEDLEYKVTGIA